MSEMKTLTLNGEQYEIADEKARQDLANLTPAKIGADALYQNQTLNVIGLTPGIETIDSIFEAVPVYSELRCAITSSFNINSDPLVYPEKTNAAVLHVTKYSSNRAEFEYSTKNGRWLGVHFAGAWSGWSKVVTDKPSGSYTGNGDNTRREIDVGGSGYSVVITAGGKLAIVSNGAGFCSASDGVSYVPYAEGHYSSGVITLETTNAALNANGVKYYYQVL